MSFTRILKDFGGRGSTGQAARPRTRLEVERLESRVVPAITASLSNAGLLTVKGTNSSETIRVHRTDLGIRVEGTQISTSSGLKDRVATTSVTKILVYGYGGNDLIDLNSNSFSNSQLLRAPAEVYGGSGDDTIYGTATSDYLDSGVGRDIIYGYAGSDEILASAGLDRVVGGTGYDTIRAFIGFGNMQSAETGRLFYSDSFEAGDGTDTIIVTLDMKSFTDRLTRPALQEIKKAVSIFDPVIDRLNRKVPVLKDYSNLTYRKLLSLYSSDAEKFIESVEAIRNLSHANYLSGKIELGTFQVVTGSSPIIKTVSFNPWSKFNSSVLDAASDAGFTFGLLDNSKAAVKMLMGQNINLLKLKLNLPEFGASISKTYPAGTIGPFTIQVKFKGTVWVKAAATFGVDMSGIFEQGDVLKGMFISNASATVGLDVWAKAGAVLGVSDTWSIASVMGYGKVSVLANFDLLGNRSVLYFDDIPNYYTDSFDVSGRIEYDIGLEIKYFRLKWTGYYWEWLPKYQTWSFGSGGFDL